MPARRVLQRCKYGVDDCEDRYARIDLVPFWPGLRIRTLRLLHQNLFLGLDRPGDEHGVDRQGQDAQEGGDHLKQGNIGADPDEQAAVYEGGAQEAEFVQLLQALSLIHISEPTRQVR